MVRGVFLALEKGHLRRRNSRKDQRSRNFEAVIDGYTVMGQYHQSELFEVRRNQRVAGDDECDTV